MEYTEEDIQRMYNALMDSVNLIKAVREQESMSEEDLGVVSRNLEHLRLMKAKDFWSDEDFTEVDALLNA